MIWSNYTEPPGEDEPSRAERAFEIAMSDMTAEDFVALLKRHERIRELAFEAIVSGRTCPTNCAGLAAMAYSEIEDAVRSDIEQDERNEAALARHLDREYY